MDAADARPRPSAFHLDADGLMAQSETLQELAGRADARGHSRLASLLREVAARYRDRALGLLAQDCRARDAPPAQPVAATGDHARPAFTTPCA